MHYDFLTERRELLRKFLHRIGFSLGCDFREGSKNRIVEVLNDSILFRGRLTDEALGFEVAPTLFYLIIFKLRVPL